MTITYEEALATLSSMFSTYTSAQLDAVLRHHSGHMEHTVDTLLSHTGSPEELVAMIKRGELPVGGNTSAGTSGGGHNIDADEELARQLAREDQQSRPARQGFVPPGQRRTMASNVTAPPRTSTSTGAQSTSAQKKGRGTPTTLPSDFLRIPGQK